MRITRLRIQNFRSIKSLDLKLGETTVFIGQNNSGKTAILDAVRIALTRRWGQRGTGFTEYDVHLATDEDDPKQSAGVSVKFVPMKPYPANGRRSFNRGWTRLFKRTPRPDAVSLACA